MVFLILKEEEWLTLNPAKKQSDQKCTAFESGYSLSTSLRTNQRAKMNKLGRERENLNL